MNSSGETGKTGAEGSLVACFSAGATYPDYQAALSMHRDLWADTYRRATLTRAERRALAFLARRLPVRVPVLVICEDWCGDAVRHVPVLARVAEVCPPLELRIFARDRHPELMDRYLTEGKRKIPVFVFFDGEGKERGRWVERPAAATRLLQEGAPPDILWERFSWLCRETVKEVTAILTAMTRREPPPPT